MFASNTPLNHHNRHRRDTFNMARLEFEDHINYSIGTALSSLPKTSTITLTKCGLYGNTTIGKLSGSLAAIQFVKWRQQTPTGCQYLITVKVRECTSEEVDNVLVLQREDSKNSTLIDVDIVDKNGSMERILKARKDEDEMNHQALGASLLAAIDNTNDTIPTLKRKRSGTELVENCKPHRAASPASISTADDFYTAPRINSHRVASPASISTADDFYSAPRINNPFADEPSSSSNDDSASRINDHLIRQFKQESPQLFDRVHTWVLLQTGEAPKIPGSLCLDCVKKVCSSCHDCLEADCPECFPKPKVGFGKQEDHDDSSDNLSDDSSDRSDEDGSVLITRSCKDNGKVSDEESDEGSDFSFKTAKSGKAPSSDHEISSNSHLLDEELPNLEDHEILDTSHGDPHDCRCDECLQTIDAEDSRVRRVHTSENSENLEDYEISDSSHGDPYLCCCEECMDTIREKEIMSQAEDFEYQEDEAVQQTRGEISHGNPFECQCIERCWSITLAEALRQAQEDAEWVMV